MKRKLSSVTFWLLIFLVLVAVQTYSAIAQPSAVQDYWTDGSTLLCLNEGSGESCFKKEEQ